MTNEDFLDKLQIALTMFKKAISTDENQWIVKGFIDIYKNIYTISLDTKIISKVLELLLFPLLKKFVVDNGIELKLCPQQNFYPDITFIDKTTNKLFVVDIKTTYRIDDKNVNGMTLGSFTGYFRNRNSNKNIVFPYYQYSGHFILGIIYSQSIDVIDEQKKYTLDDLQKIPSVIHDFHFFAQPKYKIATYHPGSGNTKNIGAITKIEDLINGSGPFSELGEDIFELLSPFMI